MVQRQKNPLLRWFASAKRVFWTVLLLMHLSALRSEWLALGAVSSHNGWGTSLLRALALTASATFFAFKIVDVRWLRLRSGWRSVVASLLVISLLHVNVLGRATRTDLSGGPAPLGIVLCVGTLIDPERLRRAFARILSIADAAFRPAIHPRPFACGLTGPAWEQAFKPRLMRIITHSAPLRAPPV